MKRAIVYVVVAAVFLVGLGAAVVRLRQPARQITGDIKTITADTGDVMSSATYQRFAARREAVVAMKQALLEVASIESVSVADSGRPITGLPPGGVKFDPAKIGVSIWVLRDRWVATAQTYGNFSTMTCMITAMVDSTTLDSIRWRYHAGAPRCAEVYFNDSVFALLPPPPPPPLPATAPEAPASPLRAPRHHRDWGPVNNTPPPTPWIAQNECEGEGCTTKGQWAACSTLVAVSAKRLDSPAVFRVQRGETFTALTSDVHVLVPGMVVFRDTISNAAGEANDVDSIRFTPADTLYTLNYEGEGYLTWWFRGQAAPGYQFWEDFSSPKWAPKPTDRVALVRRQKAVTWVRVRNAAGTEGWIVEDGDKMATGGYMDEIERCLRK